MAGYNDYQTEEEYVSAEKSRIPAVAWEAEAKKWEALAREAAQKLAALSSIAESVAWSANTSLMDDQIKAADDFLVRARKAGVS